MNGIKVCASDPNRTVDLLFIWEGKVARSEVNFRRIDLYSQSLGEVQQQLVAIVLAVHVCGE